MTLVTCLKITRMTYLSVQIMNITLNFIQEVLFLNWIVTCLKILICLIPLTHPSAKIFFYNKSFNSPCLYFVPNLLKEKVSWLKIVTREIKIILTSGI